MQSIKGIKQFAILFLASSLNLAAQASALPNTPAKITAPTAPAPTQTNSNTQFAKPVIKAAPLVVPAAPNIDAKGWILMDADTGFVMAENNANTRMAPASLTKLMTMYVISAALANGHIHLDDRVTISEDAWKTGGSRMFVQVGTQVPVKDLIDGIIVASGNDACVAMAEYVGGTVDNFVAIMNQTAQQLGMKNTHFTDSTGLPDPDHYSTPYDFALLARAIIENYPEDYSLYKQQSVSWNNITQANRNRLLWLDPSVDGLKTGHTDDAGYCLVASAKREGMRLISVVMGAPSVKSRTQDSQALLNYGFRFYQTGKLANAKERVLEEKVWYGKSDKVAIGAENDLYVTAKRNEFDQIKTAVEVNKPLNAPIKQGQVVGKLVATLNGQTVAETNLIAIKDVPEAGIFSRAWDRLKLFFHRTET